uniref:Uncharacterized protein n=1 Tax=Amphimedon queenslandica TaxID=400682 RepID=A0A1X7UC29_AMPQE
MDNGSEAVDAFTVNWEMENNYFCPHFYLIPRLLFHARCCKCVGTLVVPEWPQPLSGPFFGICMVVLRNVLKIICTCHWSLDYLLR